MALSKEMLPGLTEKQLCWAFEKAMKHFVFFSGRKAWCSVCGEVFEVSKDDQSASFIECPHCHRKSKVVKSMKRKHEDDCYLQVITTFRGWQVIRYYYANWRCQKGEAALFWQREVMQKWCKPGQKMVTLGVNLSGFPYQMRCPFSIWGGGLTVKTGSWHTEWMTCRVYPVKKILPEYRKCGFNGRIPKSLDAEIMFGKVFSNPFTEMLYKTGQTAMLVEAVKYDSLVNKYWKTIRIALRHRFAIPGLKNYLDYLDMLVKLKMDIQNPKYVAPANWREAHDTVLHTYNRRLERERREREERWRRERIAEMERRLKESQEQQIEYSERIARFATLDITDGTIDIRPLMSIQEFADEGREMDHCVFSNEYYLEKDSLILSAKIDGIRIETIEVDMTDFTVAQSQGRSNIPSEHHVEIVNLVNANMRVIRKLSGRKNPIRKRVAMSA